MQQYAHVEEMLTGSVPVKAYYHRWDVMKKQIDIVAKSM